MPILSTGSVVSLNDGLAALPDLMLPKVVPGDLSVRTIIVGNDPVKVGVGVFYSVRPIAQNEDWDAFFLDGRAIAVGEEPSRRNPAADVQAAWGDQALIVRVGNNDAALVAGQGHPTYDLSWSDGTLDFSGHASFTVSPSELVDLARSFYCP